MLGQTKIKAILWGGGGANNKTGGGGAVPIAALT